MFDQIVGGVLGQLGGNQQGPLMQVVMQMVQGQSGGLSGLLQKFQGAGLEQQVASWVGTGQNMPVSGDQIAGVFGSDAIAGFAQKLGMDPQQISGGLASLLPQVVDKLTPNGAVEEGSLQERLGGLMSQFGR